MSTLLQKNDLNSYNFRDELKAQFEQRKKVNERYSLRAFAHFLDIDAPTLQKIKNGFQTLDKLAQTLTVKSSKKAFRPVILYLENTVLTMYVQSLLIAVCYRPTLKKWEAFYSNLKNG